MITFLMEYFNQWGFISGLVAVFICLGYSDICHLYYTLAEEPIKEEAPNPNFVPPSTAKPLEIELSREPYLDSIQAYSMDDLGCVGEHYEYVYSNGNIVYLPFKARKAHTIYIEYVYRKGDILYPTYEIIRR